MGVLERAWRLPCSPACEFQEGRPWVFVALMFKTLTGHTHIHGSYSWLWEADLNVFCCLLFLSRSQSFAACSTAFNWTCAVQLAARSWLQYSWQRGRTQAEWYAAAVLLLGVYAYGSAAPPCWRLWPPRSRN